MPTTQPPAAHAHSPQPRYGTYPLHGQPLQSSWPVCDQPVVSLNAQPHIHYSQPLLAMQWGAVASLWPQTSSATAGHSWPLKNGVVLRIQQVTTPGHVWPRLATVCRSGWGVATPAGHCVATAQPLGNSGQSIATFGRVSLTRACALVQPSVLGACMHSPELCRKPP